MLVKYKNTFFGILQHLKLKNAVYKFKNMSEVAVGGGVSKLQTKSEVLGFFLTLP